MAKYFTTVKLASGEWKNIVFESDNRLKTWAHQNDFRIQLCGAGIKLADKELFDIQKHHAYRCRRISRFMDGCYLLTKKNMDEQCFDDYPTIDLTAKPERKPIDLDSLSVTIEVEISELDADIWEIEKAVKKKFGENWKFDRTESRYESCIMAIFERY